MNIYERYEQNQWRNLDKPKRKPRLSKRQKMLMRGKYRVPICQRINWQGRRDARLGLTPRLECPDYLAGFSRQYVREQIQSNTAPF
jgi:hypothetical protein